MDTTATTTVDRRSEVYDFWRRLDNLPEFMAHLEEVRPDGNGRSHWRASAPFGRTVEWDAEITEDVPGQLIAWRSRGAAPTSTTRARSTSCPPRAAGAPRST